MLFRQSNIVSNWAISSAVPAADGGRRPPLVAISIADETVWLKTLQILLSFFESHWGTGDCWSILGNSDGIFGVNIVENFNVLPGCNFSVEMKVIFYEIVPYCLNYMWCVEEINNFSSIMEEPGIFRSDTHFSDKLLIVGANIRVNSFNMQSYIFHSVDDLNQLFFNFETAACFIDKKVSL